MTEKRFADSKTGLESFKEETESKDFETEFQKSFEHVRKCRKYQKLVDKMNKIAVEMKTHLNNCKID